ncbi:diguanylate cyclase [Conexibacter sp. DBS9H8]|uniref:diguanylate cyclase n=1 Tax=Conexibacter sp. DBS9H8 TaxID=2937801 RepID=UPI00200CECAD|nr:diguanylate cyclase [Conexibacter sp. DBS9H8]
MVARHAAETALRTAGYDVLTAEDGADALTLAREYVPDVILLDHEMPILNGHEVLAQLQADPQLAEIPVIFLTGVEDAGHMAASLAAGALDYLRKPFERRELLARVGVARRLKRVQDELRARNEQLEQLAFIDPLTRLFNRRAAADKLAELISRSQRRGAALSVVLLDIDSFKAINDTFGHDAGDRVLSGVAARLHTRARREDVLARWGGEEFVALLADIGPAGALKVAEAFRDIVANTPFTAADDGTSLRVTVSVGAASWTGDGAEALLRRADAAMYEAKRAGGDAARLAPL